MILKTACNKEYRIFWGAVSSIDGFFRFKTASTDIPDVLSVFMDPEETSVLVVYPDDMTSKSYEGYTAFKGINVDNDGTIVTLGRNS